MDILLVKKQMPAQTPSANSEGGCRPFIGGAANNMSAFCSATNSISGAAARLEWSAPATSLGPATAMRSRASKPLEMRCGFRCLY
ncbi:MAG: hypothetical protein KIT86_13455 [Hydrogenophaga sp.]|uniref:hypothetical protein n=1 Tax=Hydrogenophaga sp. TaxID=1904254 RepID=UPI002603988F|nr:hypothetical protein [Hydrogenophaga sp.]MCW5670668.1 hypothetical protein [Hydrogenophaga sp.]